MNVRIISNILGRVLLTEALLLLAPLFIASRYGEAKLPFFAPIVIVLAVGAALTRVRPESRELYAKEGFIIVALTWILLSLFGCLPFIISGEIPDPVDALFETISGFTTTGASILKDPESLSRSCMFWRLFTHWIGGMGVLVFISAVLPVAGDRFIHVLRAEVPGPMVNKIVPRAKKNARILYRIYIILTVAEFLLLLAGGMGPYDALLHSFATAGTGGFSTRGASIAAFGSTYVEMTIAVFMLLFSCNFNLFYLLFLRQWKEAFKSEELKIYLGIAAASSVLIAFIIKEQAGDMATAFKLSFFQTASLLSTTGFSTCDFNVWPESAKWILLMLMLIGGCAGSTAGGLKVSRITILIKSFGFELKKLMKPSRIRHIWFEGKALGDSTVHDVFIFFSIYTSVALIVPVLISSGGYGMMTEFSASIACISNIGPGLEGVGPALNYSAFSSPAKLLLSLEMLLGRLEIFPMMVLLSAVFNRRPLRIRRD